MSTLLDMLLTDENIDPRFRRQFSDTPEARRVIATDALERAAKKASPRRFTGEPITAMGDLDSLPHNAQRST